jgi:hypothetical protein
MGAEESKGSDQEYEDDTPGAAASAAAASGGRGGRGRRRGAYGAHHDRMRRFQDNFKKEDFQTARNSNTVEGAVEALEMVAKNLNALDPTTIEMRQIGRLDRVCFLVVNTYVKEAYKLGPGPLNDSLTVGQNLHEFRYRICFVHNTTPAHFLKWLKFFLEHVTDSLFVFYTGHGASIKDRDGDEADGMDEVMVFDVGYVVDDELANYLRQYCKVKHTVLLSDCCHSGSIWDIDPKPGKKPIPPNVLSISASLDSQTAKQTKMNKMDQGIFTFYFWKYFTEVDDVTPNQLGALVNKQIAKYTQMFVASTTSPEMLDKPFITQPPPRERRKRGGRGGKP